ncbi:MAG: elongation factor P [Candidatus Portnoybacteria bacterium]
MLSHNDLKKGVEFILDNQPYEVLESSFVFKARGSSTVQAKIKNLITGNVIPKTFHPADKLKEAEIEKILAVFIYNNRGKFVFHEEGNPSSRFELEKEVIGKSAAFLKTNEKVEAVKFNDRIINIVLPIKVKLKVAESPPGIKGDRAQGGNKSVTVENGATVNVPLFIKQGDIIEINTETGEYVKRAE